MVVSDLPLTDTEWISELVNRIDADGLMPMEFGAALAHRRNKHGCSEQEIRYLACKLFFVLFISTKCAEGPQTQTLIWALIRP